MYFWGQDVQHPEGNLLTKCSFERLPSRGLKGTSCYRREWRDGHIELYGACAGWYGRSGGFTYIRPRHCCSVWLSGDETPVPGAWQNELINSSATTSELYLASLPFLDWLIDYEKAIVERFGPNYRKAHHASYRKVPKARAWINPSLALNWFQSFRDTPDQLVRPKKLIQK